MAQAAPQPDQLDLLTHPIGFTEGLLGLSLYPWQDDALRPLFTAAGPKAIRTKTAVLAPNGAGKSERIVAASSLYWAYVYPRGKVVITSKDSKQLNEQIVPAIKKHIHKFEGWHAVDSPYFKVTTPTGGSIHAFVTDESSRAEGWHKEDDNFGPLLFIVDEAKSVPEPIFDAVDRCTWNALLLTSSGGLMTGRFFDAFHKNRESFNCVQAGLKDCPHIPKDKVDDLIATHGINHPLVRSTIFGEFMQQDDADMYICPLVTLQSCINYPPKHRKGFVAAFCDAGGANAEHVIAYRNGNKVDIAAAWIEADKHAAAARFVYNWRKLELKPEQITGDAADKELWDLCAELGWQINRQNFGAPAMQKDIYASWGAEAWLELAAAIGRKEIILPDDDKFKAQMTTRQKLFKGSGKFGIEDKYLMQTKRGLPSPDRADAIAGVWAQRDFAALQKQLNPRRNPESWLGAMEEREGQRQLESVGAWAGM